MIDKLVIDYREKYLKYGYSPRSLGWDKGKQFLRFHALTSQFELEDCTILDIGCGFGDFNAYAEMIGIKNYRYLGIDCVGEFINEANKRYGSDKIQFEEADILIFKTDQKFDFVISSGVFNHKFIDLYDGGGYKFIKDAMKKSFDLCNHAVAFDFLSDKVDYKLDHTFHSAPEVIIKMGYEFTRNLKLDNTVFPFEYSLILYKNANFLKEKTVFEIAEEKYKWIGI